MLCFLHCSFFSFSIFFFFNHTAPTEIYTLSLHDALPISVRTRRTGPVYPSRTRSVSVTFGSLFARTLRSEEHTSELQSLRHLVCRLLLEKKKKKHKIITSNNK